MTYRVGRHNPRNIYRDDQHIGCMFDPTDGPLAVQALNGCPPDAHQVAELRALLAAYVDDEPCHHDHHGNCQTHIAMHEGRCANAAAKELLTGDPHPRPIRPHTPPHPTCKDATTWNKLAAGRRTYICGRDCSPAGEHTEGHP